MTTTEIRNKVFAELDSRNLANPSIRKNALDRVLDFIKISKYHENGSVILPKDKRQFKQDYEAHKGKDLTGAESSVINEIYNQYGL